LLPALWRGVEWPQDGRLKRVFLKGRMPAADFEELNELHEVKSILAERVVEWAEEWQRQGMERGRQEGESAMLQRLLERRFGPLEENLRQPIADADADTLLRRGERIFQASTAPAILILASAR